MKRLFALICLLCFLSTSPCLRPGLASDTVSARVLAKSTVSWNDAGLPAYPSGTPEVTILRIRIPAGVTLPWHTHPVINAGVLISGQLTVTTKAGDTLHLKAGDPIVEVVNTWHYGKNEGTGPADIIVFYAGVEGQAITVKESK